MTTEPEYKHEELAWVRTKWPKKPVKKEEKQKGVENDSK